MEPDHDRTGHILLAPELAAILKPDPEPVQAAPPSPPSANMLNAVANADVVLGDIDLPEYNKYITPDVRCRLNDLGWKPEKINAVGSIDERNRLFDLGEAFEAAFKPDHQGMKPASRNLKPTKDMLNECYKKKGLTSKDG